MRTEHLVNNDKKTVLPDDNGQEQGTVIAKWHWRPGMKPRFALAIGVLFSVVGPLVRRHRLCIVDCWHIG